MLSFAGFTNHAYYGYYGYQPTIIVSLYYELVIIIWVWFTIKDLGDHRLESFFLYEPSNDWGTEI